MVELYYSSICPKHSKSYHRDNCISLCIIVLFTKARCPSDERMMKMRYLYTMEFYSIIKKTEIMTFAGNGLNWKLLY